MKASRKANAMRGSTNGILSDAVREKAKCAVHDRAAADHSPSPLMVATNLIPPTSTWQHALEHDSSPTYITGSTLPSRGAFASALFNASMCSKGYAAGKVV